MSDLLKQLHRSAELMDGAEPNWLIEGREPEVKSTIVGNSGPHFVLLHGLLGAFSNWDAVIPYFSQYAQTHVIHFPITTGHRSEVKIKSLAILTEYYIRKNNLGPVILCGNSLGGHVALRLSLASPELVDTLILTGTSGLYEHTVDTLPIRPSRDFIRSQMKRVFSRPEFINDQAVEEVFKIVNNRATQLNIIHAARSAKKDFLLERLKDIKPSTLLLWGEDDFVTTMDVAHTFHSNIPGAELKTIANCGHAPMIEYPEWFAKEVQSFLQAKSKFFKK